MWGLRPEFHAAMKSIDENGHILDREDRQKLREKLGRAYDVFEDFLISIAEVYHQAQDEEARRAIRFDREIPEEIREKHVPILEEAVEDFVETFANALVHLLDRPSEESFDKKREGLLREGLLIEASRRAPRETARAEARERRPLGEKERLKADQSFVRHEIYGLGLVLKGGNLERPDSSIEVSFLDPEQATVSIRTLFQVSLGQLSVALDPDEDRRAYQELEAEIGARWSRATPRAQEILDSIGPHDLFISQKNVEVLISILRTVYPEAQEGRPHVAISPVAAEEIISRYDRMKKEREEGVLDLDHVTGAEALMIAHLLTPGNDPFNLEIRNNFMRHGALRIRPLLDEYQQQLRSGGVNLEDENPGAAQILKIENVRRTRSLLTKQWKQWKNFTDKQIEDELIKASHHIGQILKGEQLREADPGKNPKQVSRCPVCERYRPKVLGRRLHGFRTASVGPPPAPRLGRRFWLERLLEAESPNLL